MKKLVLVVLALVLAVPVLVDAGSVSSRYDVTFGGFVKYDLGYNSQNNHADAGNAYRTSSESRAVLGDEYGNTFATAAESRFNFLVKGPDLWGAKTSAFIEGDFRGVATGNAYGGFMLRHAWMKLNWTSAEILIGQAWQQWGMPYYGAWIGTSNFNQYLRGIRTPQAVVRYFVAKEFNVMFGVSSATEWAGTGAGNYVRQYNDDYARSSWPGLEGEIAYWTDRCGKIGSNNLKFALGGFYGRQANTYNVVSGTTSTWQDETLDSWMTAFRYSVPIIPEKKGSKQWALLLNGNFFYGQNFAGNNWMATSGATQGSFVRSAAAHEYAAPTVFGLFAQASFWLTDKLSVNGLYGYLKYNYSAAARFENPDRINMNQSYAVNLLWDAGQSIRFGLEWMNMFTGFNARGTGGSGTTAGTGNADRTGTLNQYRAAAWYFF